MMDAVYCLIFFGFIGWVVKMILDFLTHAAEEKAKIATNTSHEIRAALDDLSRQIAEVRDTSGQYEYSLQQLLEELSQRVATLESHHAATYSASTVPTSEVQQVGHTES